MAFIPSINQPGQNNDGIIVFNFWYIFQVFIRSATSWSGAGGGPIAQPVTPSICPSNPPAINTLKLGVQRCFHATGSEASNSHCGVVEP